jgi:hypothetical protein
MTTEQDIQNKVRMDAAKRGILLWRNNVGATRTETGRIIRYGLANDSSRVNREIKSSDLIGITPKMITSDDIGAMVGVFTAIEIKRPGWTFNSKKEQEIAQKKYIDLVNNLGGIAFFSTGGTWKK